MSHTKYSITTWGKAMNAQQISKVFIMFSNKYDSIHANKCIEVEHGRNHLITGQWWELLTSAREISINVNDPQGISVNSPKCE